MENTWDGWGWRWGLGALAKAHENGEGVRTGACARLWRIGRRGNRSTLEAISESALPRHRLTKPTLVLTIRSKYSFLLPPLWTGARYMPQPFNRIISNAHIILDEDFWLNKPETTGIVALIFATSAKIETELGTMLSRILGADSAPSIAMYEVLNTQSLKRQVLFAAAKAVLSEENFDLFISLMHVIDAVQAPRNQLAHWVWGHCKQKPKLLALADPKMVQETRQRVLHFFDRNPDDAKIDWSSIYDIVQYDVSRILAYSTGDLKRALRDLKEANDCLTNFEFILDPGFRRSPIRLIIDENPALIREEILRRLMKSRLFRDALARVQIAKGAKSTQSKAP